MKAYCIRCHEEKEMEDPQKIIARDGKRWMRGLCADCGMAVWHRLPPEAGDLDLMAVYHLP